MTKTIKYLSILAIMLLFAACEDKKEEPIEPPVVEEDIMPAPELRGVWVATTSRIDWPKTSNAAEQKQLYIDYLDKFVEANINAVYFQIRPNADAFYNSPYESWSRWITGTAGQDPGYDVLKFLIDETHARNIEFHAWINPFRITTRTVTNPITPFPALDPKINPAWVRDYPTIRVYNPALPEVRQRVVDIVSDIITKYDVDGIHMDDYFYPDIGSTPVNDTAEFRIYGKDYANVVAFRIDNVNKMIKAIHEVIIKKKPNVVFSVSPTSSIQYNLNSLYADVAAWHKEGWLDVLIPQCYSAIGAITTTTTFNRLVSDWNQFYNTNSTLMIGHYLSRVGDGTSNAFTAKEIADQYAIVRVFPKIKGSLLYSAKCFLDKDGHGNLNVIDLIKSDVYPTPAVRPFVGRKTLPDPATPTNVAMNGSTLTWTPTPGLYSVVYFLPTGATKAQVETITLGNTYNIKGRGKYFVTAVNKNNVQSEKSRIVAYE